MKPAVLLFMLFLLLPDAAGAQETAMSDPVGQAAELRNRKQFSAAIELLRKHVSEHPGDAHAQFLLGETLYWIGDWNGAKRHFTRALHLNPGQAEARRQLDEIRQVTTPWITISAGHRSDDQPLRRSAAMIEAGLFLAPLQRLIFSAEPQRFQTTEHPVVFTGQAEWRAYWPGSRLDTELAAGYLRHQNYGASDWTGRASIGVRLPEGFSLGVRSKREPYLWTIASLETPVTTEEFQGIAAWNRKGWLAEAAYGMERFPDANQVWRAHAWLLAPLLRSGGHTLQAGYAAAFTDSAQSRWNPPHPESGEGRYAPYYTPENHRVHSIIVSAVLPLNRSLIFRANGSLGFYARELAPPSQPGQASVLRSFRAGNARASLEVALARGVALTISGEHSRTSFWRMNRFDAGLTYRFLPAKQPSFFHD